MKLPVAILLAACLTTNALGQSTILWDESVNGPFANYYLNATPLGAFSLGTNSLLGATEIEPIGGGYLVHEDYFRFLVPANALVVGIYLQIDRPNVWVWLGDESYGSALIYESNPSSGELIARSGIAPLGAGRYAAYLANLDPQPQLAIANYRLDFIVQTVPEPSAWALLLLGAPGCFLQIRQGLDRKRRATL